MNSGDEELEYQPFTGPLKGEDWCGFEWSAWRKGFESFIEAHNVDTEWATYLAFSCMKGEAATRTRHIQREHYHLPNHDDIAGLLDRLEAQFCPPPGSAMAELELQMAKGWATDHTTMQIWHSLIAFLWKNASPDIAHTFETHPQLRGKFIAGIADKSVQLKVLDYCAGGNSKTYSETLDLALQLQANVEITRMEEKRRRF